jgi:hypothetical protein
MSDDIQRTAVTADGFSGGVKRPEVVTGEADPVRARIAKRATTAGGFGGQGGGRGREAGMMFDFVQTTQPYSSGFQLDAYRTSYANGLDQRSGTYDVPTYFVTMNEQNGGILYWPVTLQEKYQWYRYWARTDAYVGRALELLSDLPMSKLTLNMPEMEDLEKQEEILRFFTYQTEVLGLFELCQSILWEMNMIGNVYIFHEWDSEKKIWARAVMLPPEEVYIFQYPFSENKRVEYRPERLMSLIKGEVDMQPTLDGNDYNCDRSSIQSEILESIPDEIKDMVHKEGCIVMDTDPASGSFVHHVARRKSPYEDLGASVLERVLIPMLQKEHYRYTQLSLASRNMTPKNLITAPGLLPAEVDELRTQVDLGFLDPEYSIITNYEVSWELIGAQDRLLDLSREYETIESQVFAGLGVTRELLTGESGFSGTKITVEILNTMFLLSREVLKNYIEKQLFQPVAEAHGWFDEDRNGIKTYHYPEISFNRLTIRDNAEVFDSLYQLYQKGSLNVDVILELFNLNADEVNRNIKKDLFTVKDATFNRMVEEVNSETGRKIAESSNIAKKTADYLGLEFTEGEGGDEGGFGGGGFGDFGGGFGEEEAPAEDDEFEPPAPDAPVEDTSTEEKIDEEKVVDEVVEDLPSDASEKDIRDVIDDKFGDSDSGGADEDKMAEEVIEDLPSDASEKDIRDAIEDKFGG